jgi:predicted nucleic-acid-binding Zn-ribbon protein
MKNGRCPKCQSVEIFVNSEKGLYHRGEVYAVQLRAKKDFDLECYVCADCGFVQLYVAALSTGRKPESRAVVLAQDNDWHRLPQVSGSA